MRTRQIAAIPVVILCFCLGCSPSKRNFSKEYNAVWKEMIKSQAWENSLQAGLAITPSENKDFFYSSSDVGISESDAKMGSDVDSGFEKKYHSLVSRAYFKIIAQAERSDRRLKAEYARLLANEVGLNRAQSKMYEENLAMVSKRYYAHKEMLEGLKSWNIFSEYRSGDLDYFKEDNFDEVYSMYQQGMSDDGIIEFLIFRLADLYHFEE
ncbi:hypothetical protein [Poritiphilus flavus]|uniref:Uncharacterized protein n=1 Tax=Poritiphilus flavus TaxID=2697053 RepID=A0A6L9ECT8_9FLAO|nr:hypothetical protein [Poritiphilus flavus]NAS12433.1 hypothetical protein [Poritiphilus flavus]